MKTIKKIASTVLPALLFFTACNKEESKTNNTTTGKQEYVLVIDNGPVAIKPDEKLTMTAHLVDQSGNSKNPSTITWTCANSSIGSVNSSGAFTYNGLGTTSIKASTTVNGVSYTAEVPLKVSLPTLFAVAPSAIIYEAGGSLTLEPIAFSTSGTPSFTYTSDDNSVASVNSSGLVTFNKVGSTVIHVKTKLNGSDAEVTVPVMVIAAPEISIPVVNVNVTPASSHLFIGDKSTLTAKAYNLSGAEVTSVFTWTSSDDQVASVSSNGEVTAKTPGEARIFATTSGIFGYADIVVSPDTVIIVSPMTLSIAPGKTGQLTAKAYSSKTMTPINSITNFKYEMVDFGFNMFQVGTINNNGLITVKNDASSGIATIAYVTIPGASEYVGGASVITVALPDISDCGTGNALVKSIFVQEGSSATLSSFNTLQLNAFGRDINNNNVTNDDLHYNSDNMQVASVSSSGEITALTSGTAVITICSGNYASTTFTVTVP